MTTRIRLKKRRILMWLAVLVIVTFMPAPCNAGELPATRAVASGWTVEPVATGFVTGHLDLEVDSRDMAHLVYYNESVSHLEYRRRTAPGVWEDWNFPYEGRLPALDYDPTEQRWYVLFKEEVTGDLKLAWKNAQGSWTAETAMTGESAFSLSFEMASGTAHIACSTYANEIKYRHFDPDGLSYTISIAGPSRPAPVSPSLALRSDGLPRISFEDGSQLLYAVTSDTFAWSLQTVDDVTPFAVRQTSLALDSVNTPHIGYEGAGALKYATKVLFSWSAAVIPAAPNGDGQSASLALDPNSERPRIAHRGVGCPVCFTARQPDGTWTSTMVTATNPQRQKLVLMSNGDALIAFTTDNGIYLAIQSSMIFNDGFESGDTSAW